MINDIRERDHKEFLKSLFDMYVDVFDRKPEIFRDQSYTLQPLSVLVAEIFDKLTPLEVMLSLRMLGNMQIENYSESLIEMLINNYSEEEKVKQIFMEDFALFTDFAEVWPKFLSNKPLIDTLTMITGENLDLETQARIIGIQT